jgi:hypothetical protein
MMVSHPQDTAPGFASTDHFLRLELSWIYFRSSYSDFAAELRLFRALFVNFGWLSHLLFWFLLCFPGQLFLILAHQFFPIVDLERSVSSWPWLTLGF